MITLTGDVDTSKTIEKLQRKGNKLWTGSINESFKYLSNQGKGKFGVETIIQLLKQQGYDARGINDEGDLEYKSKNDEKWIKAEVKTCTVNLDSKEESAWFNQIRPNQKSWEEVWLVSVYPNHVKIFAKSREDFLNNVDTMDSTKRTLNHVGTNELLGVTLRPDNMKEWTLIYSNQEGGRL
jgi:hypothetical protein